MTTSQTFLKLILICQLYIASAMSTFFARVELKNVETNSYELYEKLHTQMAKQGFERTFAGASGAVYQLPDVTYRGEFDAPTSEVIGFVNTAVKAIGATAGVLVVEEKASIVSGLTVLKAAPKA